MKLVLVILSCFLILNSCTTKAPSEPKNSTSDFDVKVLKWFDGHKSAVSITYDAAWGNNPMLQNAVDEILQRNLTMDFELVTKNYNNPDKYHLIEEFKTNLMPYGIHFYGHGNRHINHDSLSYSEAYDDFKLCFDLMKSWDLNPSAYAYPGARGYLIRTQLANKNAGFICARGATVDPSKFYISPDTKTEPDNWFYLPAVFIGTQDTVLINNHAEMQVVFNSALQKSAWIILMYHSIGIVGGWGYYPFAEFIKDLDYIKSEDFWSGNMDMVAKYIKERNNLVVQKTFLSSDSDRKSTRLNSSHIPLSRMPSSA